MPPAGPTRPEYDQKPNHGPGFRPVESPASPQAKQCQFRPLGLQFRGVREERGSGAYKLVLLSLNQRGGTKLPTAPQQGLQSRLVAATGTKGWHQSRLVVETGTNTPLQSRLLPPTGTKGPSFPPFGLLKRNKIK